MGGELPGHTLITTPNRHPPGPRAKLILGLPLQCLDSISVLPAALPSPKPFSVFLGQAGFWEIGLQTEQLEIELLRPSSAPLFPSCLPSLETLSFPLLSKGRGARIQQAPA